MIKDIKGYEGEYFVDDYGNVYSAKKGSMKMMRSSINKSGYKVIRLFKEKVATMFYIHRLVCQAFLEDYSRDLQVDHIDRDKSNNNLSNLRMVTHQKNHFNRNAAGYYWHKRAKKWMAYIGKDGHVKHLGYFIQEEDARAAYLAAKEVLHIIWFGEKEDNKMKKYKKVKALKESEIDKAVKEWLEKGNKPVQVPPEEGKGRLYGLRIDHLRIGEKQK